MSSVLIKGMTMPKDCRECPLQIYYRSSGDTLCYPTDKYLAEKYNPIGFEGRANWCPLVEVEPHGDLIDRDALNLEYEVEMADHWKTAHEIANCVKYAPTVIEAEGE